MTEVGERKQAIQSMFNGIARRYDLLNHLLSAGIDVYWRRRALSLVRAPDPRDILDLATGTGDFALAARRLQPDRIVGIDVALEMVRIGVGKIQAGDGSAISVRLLGGDAELLPFADDSFDLVTVAFGARNFGHIPDGLAEAFRVMRPGGELVVLDFTEPTLFGFRQLYNFYFRRILPVLGGIVSGNRKAYSYLPRSVANFPQGQIFIRLLADTGFQDNRETRLTMGICAIYQGFKRG
ncbi:MAG: bifunctional demethylmenaquinone methyltransferase/2-methoxy-6-polyprenyl-1,4-benzoquinol methylase UbiE [Candidatus Latescibacterota bacterium]|nr:bifunctional demethylmenaquinone methyltransferase/2-methoxy-6-polyprenyl-1,4-benzoquinol methylase UbiE [Candidatus Latescibacterota bacterium]